MCVVPPVSATHQTLKLATPRTTHGSTFVPRPSPARGSLGSRINCFPVGNLPKFANRRALVPGFSNGKRTGPPENRRDTAALVEIVSMAWPPWAPQQGRVGGSMSPGARRVRGVASEGYCRRKSVFSLADSSTEDSNTQAHFVLLYLTISPPRTQTHTTTYEHLQQQTHHPAGTLSIGCCICLISVYTPAVSTAFSSAVPVLTHMTNMTATS